MINMMIITTIPNEVKYSYLISLALGRIIIVNKFFLVFTVDGIVANMYTAIVQFFGIFAVFFCCYPN